MTVRKVLLAGAGTVLSLAVLLAFVAAALPLFGLPSVAVRVRGEASESEPSEGRRSAELVPGEAQSLRLPGDVVQALGIRTVRAEKASQPRLLEMPGALALDTNHLARVHSRFPGEVVQIGEAAVRGPGGKPRPLRPGDQVEPGQLLAVVWSKDLGEKKSELVDALSQLRLDEESLTKLEDLYRSGNTSEAAVRQMRRNVEAGRIAVAKAERTLRSWRLTEDEIQAVKDEAARLRAPGAQRDLKREQDWAKVEVRARFGGKVVEKNVALGDIVDTSTDLFKVADLSRLAVWANAYEEDLPALLALPPERWRWTVRVKADPDAAPLEGTFDSIGDIIDPSQHAALVRGDVANPQGRLRAGQFITATVELPPSPYECAIPASSLIEDGRQAVVFVQPDAGEARYSLRRVAVSRRLPGLVCVRGRLKPDEERKGLAPLAPDELVVRSGAVQLKAALEELSAAGGKEAK
jgi:cobalt-zinc-cadmium efflux system membrane fusion protein